MSQTHPGQILPPNPPPPTPLFPANPQTKPSLVLQPVRWQGRGVQVNVLPAKLSITPGLHPGVL